MDTTETTEAVQTAPKFHVCPACKSDVSTDGCEIRKVGESRTDHFVPIAEHNAAVKGFEKQIEDLDSRVPEEVAEQVPASVPELQPGPAKKSKVRFRL